MEIFNRAKAVKLRSHLDKYLVADDDQETIRQSRNGLSRRARWLVEIPEDKPNVIRLKSCHGKYLTASDMPFLLGMTGRRVLQTILNPISESDPSCIEWKPERDGFQVVLKSNTGKYLRANGGTPPWRNSITHDKPRAGGTKGWVLWEVESVTIPENEAFMDYMSSVSSFSSVSDDIFESEAEESEAASPMSVISHQSTTTGFSSRRSAMEFFHNAKAVRLRSHHDKYLLADDDEESVIQDRNGSSKSVKWTVEFVPNFTNVIRLKSCYNKYLTASNQPFLLGMTGRKVLQTLPKRLDSSVEWEPVREGAQVKLKTRYGHFLRANGGLPPWRNSITHDIPHRTATQEWVLWDVDVVEIQVHSPTTHKPAVQVRPISHNDSSASDVNSHSSVSVKSETYSRQESNDSMYGSPPKMEGRTVYYQIAADEYGDEGDTAGGYPLTFNGNDVAELTRKLQEETGLMDIIVCTRNPLNNQLYPLRLQLPPNITMHVVVVPSSSKVARDLAKSGIIL